MAERSIEFETLLSALRSRRLHRFLTVVLLLFGGCYLLEGPPLYYSDPIRIRVVDEGTGKPVAGAVALAQWEGQSGFGNYRYLQIQEAVSDQNGWFTLPGWWIVRSPLWTMTFRDPVLEIYKPGGYWGGAENDGAHGFSLGRSDPWRIERIAFWNGKTVPLMAIKDAEFEGKVISSVEGRLYDGREHGPSELPQLWHAIETGKELVLKRSAPSTQRR